MSKTLHTQFGKVRTASTRRFVAVIRSERGVRAGTTSHPGGVHIHARADQRETLETRLRREGFTVDHSTGLHVMHERASIVDGVPTPGALIAAVQIVATS